MIHSIQTNVLTLTCDTCSRKEVFKNKCYRAKEWNERDVFGEKGNYEFARREKGWMIRNHSCRCPECKGTKNKLNTRK